MAKVLTTDTGIVVPKKRIKMHPLMIAVLVILAIYALSLIVMLCWGFLTSLKSTMDFTENANLLGLPDLGFFRDNVAANEAKYLLELADWDTYWCRQFATQQEMYDFMVGPSIDALENARKNAFLFNNYVKAVSNLTTVQTGDYSYHSAIFGDIVKASHIPSFGEIMLNTVVYSVVCGFVCAFSTMTVGFLCAKYKYKFSGFIYSLVVIVMIIPIVGAAPSMIEVLKTFGMFDSYVGMIFQKISFTGMYFLVFFAFFQGVSDSYIEAAEIDGASQLKVFLSIMVPLAAKMLGTVFLLDLIVLWNDYQTPLLYFPTHWTLSYGIFQMVGTTASNSTEEGARGPEYQGPPQYIAGCMLLALPMLILFVFLSDKIMGSMSMGGLKE